METLHSEKVEIVSEELKVCKRDELPGGWVFSIAFVPIAFIDDNALCMVLIYVHCPALHVLTCLSAKRWILTKSPRCDGINLWSIYSDT